MTDNPMIDLHNDECDYILNGEDCNCHRSRITELEAELKVVREEYVRFAKDHGWDR